MKKPPPRNIADAPLADSENKASEGRATVTTNQGHCPVVGLGASAGGLEAFTDLLKHLPKQTGLAFALVQHLDPNRESHLCEILTRSTGMSVVEAKDGVRMEADHVYVIPPNASMTVSDGTLKLDVRVEGRGRHLPIDHFFASLALQRGNKAIGVVLSGNASDGTIGLKAIKEAGGIAFAQDEASAKFPGMPRSAINSGCVDFVMCPADIARELARLGAAPYVTADHHPEAETAPGDALNRLFKLLRPATGVDFSAYRQTTIQRRIQRRLTVKRVDSLEEYLKIVETEPAEVHALFRDILIHVTSFFRDPESFAALRTQFLPRLFENRRSDDSFRVWVPGCSTGEEAYSIAIAVLELVEGHMGVPIQIFGTDVSEQVIETARRGMFDAGIEADLSPEQLRRFFTKTERGYQINKNVRDLCVFARQNVVKDPPFSKLDLISCRNLLIYFEPALQKKLIPVFHFALKDRGYLLLGSAETVGAFGDLFDAEDAKNRIFLKRPGTTGTAHFRFGGDFPAAFSIAPAEAPGPPPPGAWSRMDVLKEADRLVAAKYCPPGLVINDAMEIIQFRGEVAPYLNPDSGEASLNLFKMTRPELATELRSAIGAARKDNATTHRQNLRTVLHGQPREVWLEVMRIDPPAVKERAFVINFELAPPDPVLTLPEKRSKREDPRVAKLAEELAATTEHLQSVVEERDATNEELRSANEEIQSSNEELQSTNEELETAKEELQSTNEELTTVNEEQWHTIGELTAVNDDLNNLLRGVCIPVVMLGRDLRIRRFTPDAVQLFRLVASDIGRKITDIKAEIDLPDIEALAQEVIGNLSIKEKELQDRQGRWQRLQVRPFVTADNVIAGAVIILFEIDDAKRADERLRHAANYADAIVETVHEPMLVLDAALRVKRATQAFCAQFQVAPDKVEGVHLYELGNRQWDIPELRSLLEKVLPADGRVRDFKVEHVFPTIGKKTMLLNARRVSAINPDEALVVLSISEIPS